MSTPVPIPGFPIPGFPFPGGAPTIFAVIPGFGPTGGGNQVLILGTNLNTITSVTFGGMPATVIAQDPIGILLVVTAPAHAAGSVQVGVTNPHGPSAPATYTYLAPAAPVVLSLVPVSGPATGGTAFTIVGANLAGASVTFSGIPATGVAVDVTGTVLTGLTPAGVAGNAAVVVTTPGGSVSVAGGFTYVVTLPPPLPPTVVTLAPVSGSIVGGLAFTIVGANLAGASVTFSGIPATGVAVNVGGTVLTGLTPAGVAGNAAVVVTTPGGSVSVAGGFTYVASPPPPLPPTVVSLAPVSGSIVGGLAFTIVGANLAGASVTFSGIPATGVAVNVGGTVLTGLTPAGVAGNAAVVVTTPGGSVSVAGGFTYV